MSFLGQIFRRTFEFYLHKKENKRIIQQHQKNVEYLPEKKIISRIVLLFSPVIERKKYSMN